MARQASSQIVALDRFVSQFIQAYVFSIHRGIVVGFGLQGVPRAYSSHLRLRFYLRYWFFFLVVRIQSLLPHMWYAGEESQHLCLALLSVRAVATGWHCGRFAPSTGVHYVHRLRATVLALGTRPRHPGCPAVLRYVADELFYCQEELA